MINATEKLKPNGRSGLMECGAVVLDGGIRGGERKSKPWRFGEEHPKWRKEQKPVTGTGLEADGTPVCGEVKAGSIQSLTGHRKEYGFYSKHDWKPLKDVRQGSKAIWGVCWVSPSRVMSPGLRVPAVVLVLSYLASPQEKPGHSRPLVNSG